MILAKCHGRCIVTADCEGGCGCSGRSAFGVQQSQPPAGRRVVRGFRRSHEDRAGAQRVEEEGLGILRPTHLMRLPVTAPRLPLISA
jgi:hypothetical protein